VTRGERRQTVEVVPQVHYYKPTACTPLSSTIYRSTFNQSLFLRLSYRPTSVVTTFVKGLTDGAAVEALLSAMALYPSQALVRFL
jgi:hypothetical protein